MTQANLKGRTATRYLKSLAAAAGDLDTAAGYARGQRWVDVEGVVQSLKAAVAPMSTTTFPLPSPAAFDFAEFVRPLTIIGRLSGLRRVPSRTRLIATTAGSTSYWVGESQVRPISALTLTGEVLEPLSVVAIVVATLELARSSDPAAETILRSDLGRAAVHAMDSAFIDPANGGENLVMPASVLSGVVPRASTGSTLSAIDADLDYVVNALSDAGSDLVSAVWIMLPRTALFLARLRGTGGNLAFPGMTAKGGELLGLPAITSAAVPGFGSPSAGIIALVDAAEIIAADDNGGAFEISTTGSLFMTDESASPAETSQVSLWQTESIAFKSVRYVNWKRLRNGMAQFISGVNF